MTPSAGRREQIPSPETALAPPIRTATGPQDASAILGTQRRHALVFAAPRGFSHEFYTLAVDSFVRDADRHGRQQTALLGVHLDWLTEAGTIRRAIFLDAEHDLLVEAEWNRPIRPDSVQFLCLGEDEQALHRELSARFPYPQLNPYGAAAPADDKSATLARWRGLETPASLTVAAGDRTAARAFAESFPESVVKPEAGTEARGVAYLARDRADFGQHLERALAQCWRRGAAALVQQRRDGVCFQDPETGCRHTLALRLNLVHDGRRHRLASAYAQIGRDAASPAACGRGGRIVGLHRAWSGLVARADPRERIAPPDATAWSELAEDAERAAAAFEGLALVGLDVVLDLCGGRLRPVFLEANPRPAGLCRSRLLSGPPSPRDPPGVGLELWDGLARLCGAADLTLENTSNPP